MIPLLQLKPTKYIVFLQGETKKRELLKCAVAAMYIWQHCGTGTLSYRQPRQSVIMDQWNGQERDFAIKMFYKNNGRCAEGVPTFFSI
jgi:hypothetical protein